MPSTIITVATTGAWPTRENNPAVPLTPGEIADDVYECWLAGAAIAHLHMRDKDGAGTMDKARFKEPAGLIVRAVHRAVDVVDRARGRPDRRSLGEMILEQDHRVVHMAAIVHRSKL